MQALFQINNLTRSQHPPSCNYLQMKQGEALSLGRWSTPQPCCQSLWSFLGGARVQFDKRRAFIFFRLNAFAHSCTDNARVWLCVHSRWEFADSKVLTAEKRDSLFEEISSDPNIGYCAEILSAQFISACMLSRDRISLNLMAMESTYKIIQAILAKGFKLTKVGSSPGSCAVKTHTSPSFVTNGPPTLPAPRFLLIPLEMQNGMSSGWQSSFLHFNLQSVRR
jgi:hypothetical protein